MQKTIIVTGASRGIGHATALRFHENGWRVITVSREPPPGECPSHLDPRTPPDQLLREVIPAT